MKSPLFLFKSSHNTFGGEEPDENVILLLRRHPFVILTKLIFFAFLLFVPVIFASTLSAFILKYSMTSLFLFISGVWYTLLWQGIFYALTMYTLDVWIVTNHRIIDSKQHGFFNRTVSELHLSRIQDITVNTKGAIPTLFHFGDLQIQTAGAEEKFLFLQIPNPEKAKDEIMKVIGEQNKKV